MNEPIRLTQSLKKDIYNSIDIRELCDIFNIKIYRDNGYQIRACCPLHGGDNPTAFSLDYEYGDNPEIRWRCRTKCGDSGDLFDFIMKMKNCSFKESLFFLCNLVGIFDFSCYINNTDEALKLKKEIIKFNREVEASRVKSKRQKELPIEINDDFVKKCVKRRNSYFKNRGYTEEVLNLFEVGFAPPHDSPWRYDEFPARMTIPIRDETGKLVGLSGRIIKENVECKCKYKIIPGSDKETVLYGLNVTLPYIEKKRSLILFEGFTDLWRAWDFGIKNTIAIMGKDLTLVQRNKILRLVHTVAIAVDNDKSGQKGGDKIVEELKRYVTVYRVYFPLGQDAGECRNKQEFLTILRNAKKVN